MSSRAAGVSAGSRARRGATRASCRPTRASSRPTSGGGERPVLRLDDVHVAYGEIPALKGVALEVRAGEIVTLLGNNGAGKTTTLRTISGLLVPSRGTMTLEDQPLAG